MISFSNTLRTLRTNHNLTQGEIAKIIGIDRSTYTYYELGITKPDFESVLMLSKYYDIELNVFADMCLKDENSSVTFRSIVQDEDPFFSILDILDFDEFEKMILFFYRTTPEAMRPKFYNIIRESFDAILSKDEGIIAETQDVKESEEA